MSWLFKCVISSQPVCPPYEVGSLVRFLPSGSLVLSAGLLFTGMAWSCNVALTPASFPPRSGSRTGRGDDCSRLLASEQSGLRQMAKEATKRPKRPRVGVALYPPKDGLSSPPPSWAGRFCLKSVYITFLKKPFPNKKCITKREKKQLTCYSGRPKARKEIGGKQN